MEGCHGRQRRQRKTLLIYIPEFEECCPPVRPQPIPLSSSVAAGKGTKEAVLPLVERLRARYRGFIENL